MSIPLAECAYVGQLDMLAIAKSLGRSCRKTARMEAYRLISMAYPELSMLQARRKFREMFEFPKVEALV
jgi:hypothetical protein